MLTAEEKEICCRLADGESFKEIAAALGCSVNTVDNRLRIVRQRFDCITLPQLTAKLTDSGLLAPPEA